MTKPQKSPPVICLDAGLDCAPMVPKSYLQLGIKDLNDYLKSVYKLAKTSQQKGRCDKVQTQIDKLNESLEKGANPIASTNQIMNILQQINLLAYEYEDNHAPYWSLLSKANNQGLKNG